jgi:hypothetical protein
LDLEASPHPDLLLHHQLPVPLLLLLPPHAAVAASAAAAAAAGTAHLQGPSVVRHQGQMLVLQGEAADLLLQQQLQGHH